MRSFGLPVAILPEFAASFKPSWATFPATTQTHVAAKSGVSGGLKRDRTSNGEMSRGSKNIIRHHGNHLSSPGLALALESTERFSEINPSYLSHLNEGRTKVSGFPLDHINTVYVSMAFSTKLADRIKLS